MISYTVVHHVPGRIRIEVPLIKRMPFSKLKKLSTLPVPSGIKKVRANPITGSLIITYDPSSIDIMVYLKELASSRDLDTFLN